MTISSNTELQLAFASLSEQTAVKNNHIRKETQPHDTQKPCSCSSLQFDTRPAEHSAGLAVFLGCGHSPWRIFLADCGAKEQSGRGGNCPRPRPPRSVVFSPTRSSQVELMTRKQSAKNYYDGALAGPDSWRSQMGWQPPCSDAF